MITLTVGANSYPLPSCYYWRDEFEWSAKSQTHTRLLPQNGQSALLVQETVKTGGQPMTLADEDGPGMMPLSLLNLLLGVANTVPSPAISVAREGRPGITAQFDFSNGPAIESRPVRVMEPPATDDLYWVTLRLIVL